MTDVVHCPARDCVKGRLETICESCGGIGTGCRYCEGFGFTISTCTLCEGTGQCTRALARLYDAAESVRRIDPTWWDFQRYRDHPGITVYSQALWYRCRPYFGEIIEAQGWIYHPDFRDGPVVFLLNGQGDSVDLTGCSWGYDGEGPSGLADILADVFPRDFLTWDDALNYVQSLSQHHSWKINHRV